jgi:hypothetical protein
MIWTDILITIAALAMFVNWQYLLAKCNKLEARLDLTERKLQVAREAAGLATRMFESSVKEMIKKDQEANRE